MKLKRIALLCLAFCLLLAVAACNMDGNESDSSSLPEEELESELPEEYPVTVLDVTVRSRPSRVVSLSPALTEKLYDIGLTDVLVGVSDYCDYPAEAASLTKCGTAQIPNLERILDLEPHLVLSQTQLADEDLIALQQADVDVVVIPAAQSIAGFKESYVSLARLLEGEYAGGELGRNFADGLQARLDIMHGYLVPYAEENGGRKNALYLRLLDFNVATGDTLEGELLEVIGLKNIARDQTGWLFPEEEAKGEGRGAFESVDIIFMDENFVTIKMLEQSAYYKGLQATLQDWYLYIDSLVFERQSLRMLGILEDMAKYAYPEAAPPVPFADSGDDGAGEDGDWLIDPEDEAGQDEGEGEGEAADE